MGLALSGSMRAPRRGKVSLLLYSHEHLLIRNKGSLLDKTLWTVMEVRSSQRIYLPLTHFDIAKATIQHCQEALQWIPSTSPMAGHLGLSLLLPFKSKVSVVSIFAAVRPESFLLLAVVNMFFFRHGRTNWPTNQTRYLTNSEAVRIGRILACTQR
jgi:hypothetical protein